MTKSRVEREERLFDFKKIGAIIEKNFIVMTRDKIRLLPLLLFPIVMIMVLGFVSGNVPKHIPVALVVYDNSQLSQQFEQKISDSQAFSIKHIVSTEGEAKKLLDFGEVNVIIEIPPNFQDDINKGVQAGITVIVDESDSSVAATSQQTLNGIISSFSSGITVQRLSSYQKSVGGAADSIASYAYDESQLNGYQTISGQLYTANGYISTSKQLSDSYSKALQNSIPHPVPLILPENSTTLYGSSYVNQTSSNVMFVQSPIAGSALAQASAFKRSSSLASSAQGSIDSAIGIAGDNAEVQSVLQQQYDSRVAQPIITIREFTQSGVEDVLTPVVYESKPAYGSGLKAIDFLIPSLIALTLFQGAVMNMGRSVAGEKREGSLTRVFLTPTSTTTIITGTLLFYVIFELVRATFLIAFSIVVFNIKIQGSIPLIALILVIYIIVSTSIGMIISSMVKTEQQFQAMAMLISLPTMFLSGAFFPLEAMPKFMQSIAVFLPITYAGNALRDVMVKALPIGMIWYPLLILLAFLVLCITVVGIMFKRDIE